MKYRVAALSAIILVFLVSSANCAIFKGKVIDADTKEPIEGAVVVAIWHGERGTPTGGTSRLEDVKETITNKSGEWTIKGPKGTTNELLENVYTILTLFTGTYYTRPPVFIVFKPGYCSYPVRNPIGACNEKLKTYDPERHMSWAYIGEIVELPKLTNREDRLKNLPDFESASSPGLSYRKAVQKQREFIKLLNVERKTLGLDEYDLKEFSHEK